MPNVKSTMLDIMLKIVAPHHCYGCDKIGDVLCSNCKYDITSEPFSGCISCRKPTGAEGCCGRCQMPYSRAWCAAERRELLEKLLNGYKFENVYAAHRALSNLLDERLPVLPDNAIIVPVPTITSHVRRRGYDHMRLIARDLAKKRQLTVETPLRRAENTVQTGANRKQRLAQATRAFTAKDSKVKANRPYLLIDDVVTTGATIEHAARTLKEAGASDVWVAVIARQPLE